MTMVLSSLPKRFEHGSTGWACKLCISSLEVLGRMDTRKASTVVCAMSYSVSKNFQMYLMLAPAAMLGVKTTTTTGPTVRWVASLRRSSRVAVLPPFRLRLNSSSTATPNPLPNRYSHNGWTKNGGTSRSLATIDAKRWKSWLNLPANGSHATTTITRTCGIHLHWPHSAPANLWSYLEKRGNCSGDAEGNRAAY